MRIKVGRVIAVAIGVELAAVLTLVLIVALFGPSDSAAAQAYAQRIGYWVGPITGFLYTLGGAWWIAKRQTSDHIMNGLALGVVVATVDIVILVISGSGFLPVFVISNVGRVVAGLMGGWLAGRGNASTVG